MSAIQLVGVGHGFSEDEWVFRDVCATLPRGWTAIVGPNGGGKSTLLRVIAGQLVPRAGQRCGPAVGLCALTEQRVDAVGDEIAAFAADWSRAAVRLRARLALDPDELTRWSSFSPGERRRWQLGAALVREPEVLLLDEPTNHVDASARALLGEALARFSGVGVLVSHDRALLAAISARTLWLERGQASLYQLPYDAARAQRLAEVQALTHAREELRARARQLERRQVQDQQRSEAATRAIGARQRIKGPRDSDAREAGARGRVAHAAAKLSRRAVSSVPEAARVAAQLEQVRVPKSVGSSLFVDYQPAPRARLATLTHAELPTGPGSLRPGQARMVERGSRVWISGPNGAGKSTLLRALRRVWSLPEERVLWLDQDRKADEDAARARAAALLPKPERARVFELLAALGAEPERVVRSLQPSPGEAQKLQLALGLARHVWLVALDEPTNHLDLPSIERLTDALTQYPGALLIATHDEPFARAVTRERWDLAP